MQAFPAGDKHLLAFDSSGLTNGTRGSDDSDICVAAVRASFGHEMHPYGN